VDAVAGFWLRWLSWALGGLFGDAGSQRAGGAAPTTGAAVAVKVPGRVVLMAGPVGDVGAGELRNDPPPYRQ
jgi:hypothetical protein